MYVRAGFSAAYPADSHVQARTALRKRRQKHLQRRVPSAGERPREHHRAALPRIPGMLGLPAAAASPCTGCLPAMHLPCTSRRPAPPGNAVTPEDRRGARKVLSAEKMLDALRSADGIAYGGPGAAVRYVTSGLAGRRIAVGLAAATAIVGTAVTASAAYSAAWATAVFGTAAVILSGALLIDVLRRRFLPDSGWKVLAPPTG
jgi:hypothetical protein